MRHGCHGCTGCTGCTGCSGYTGCTGCIGTVVVPPPPVMKKEEKKEEAYRPAPATIIVSLPVDAKLSIDEAVTTSTSTQRVFLSPELPAGRDFSYTLKAEFQHEGKPVVVSKKVNVRAGMESRVTIGSADLTGIASR